MNFKKVTALLLATLMTMTVVTGCGNDADQPEKQESSNTGEVIDTDSNDVQSEEEEDKSLFPLEEPYEIDVMVCTGSVDYKFEDTIIFKHMEEMTNVKMNVIPVADDREQVMTTAFSTGDYPDVLIKGGVTRAAEYGDEGILVDLKPYLEEYAPNFCALIDERGIWNEVIGADGAIYSLGGLDQQSLNAPYTWINTTWLDNLGLEMPTSIEELYDVLKAFKEQDADGDGNADNEIPFLTCDASITPLRTFATYFNINMKSWWESFSLSEDKSTVEYYPATDEFKEFLFWMRKFYEEGLLYEYIFTLGMDQAAAMVRSGEVSVGMFPGWAPDNIVEPYDPNKSEEENPTLQYEILQPFEGMKHVSSSGYYNDGAFVITDKCERPEVMVAWVDYLYSEEGALLCWYGEEGDTYDMVDGKVKLRNELNPSTTYGNEVQKALFQMGGMVGQPSKNYLSDYEVYYDLEANPLNGYVQNYTIKMIEEGKVDEPWPALSLSADSAAEAADISADVDPYWQNYLAEVVTGVKDLDDTWDEYLKTMEDMKLSRLVEIYNEAYQAYLNK